MSATKQHNQKRQRTGKGRGQLAPIAHKVQRANYKYHGVSPEHDQNLLMTNVFTFGNATSTQTFRTAVNSYVPISGENCPGEYVNWARMYDFYRVSRFRLSMTISNNEAFPVAAVLFTSNEDPGSTFALNDASDMPFARKVLLAAKGSGKDTRKMTISQSVGTLVGSIAPESADSYRAIINTSPADVVWGCLTLETATGAAMVTGVSIMYELEQTFRFYNADLVTQDTPPSLIPLGPAHATLTDQQKLDYIQAYRVAERNQRKKS